MAEKKLTEADDHKSKVKVQLLDPLGNSIANLQYQIKEGGRIVAKGATDAHGNIATFLSQLGTELTVHVQRFASDEMKAIKTLVPWADEFSVKLLSGKVKKQVELVGDKGPAGSYKRQTYKVKAGDSLWKIAEKHDTSAAEIAKINGMKVTATIHPEQILKLPATKHGTPPGGSSAPTTPATLVEHEPEPSSPAGGKQSETETPGAPPAPAQVPEKKPAATPAADANQPVPTKNVDARGENGTPKTSVELACDKTACIKLGDKGPLIEEINIRLMGFGGTASEGKSFEEFTTETEAAVRRFQEDYMGIAPSGKVCGSLLVALDEFCTRHPIRFSSMLCQCNHCRGFGNRYRTSEKSGIKNKAGTGWANGVEYPGIHRALIWGFRAALFYTSVKDAALEYRFLKVSSGYRCWMDNKAHGRRTNNHMGNALDLQFTKGAATRRCEGADVNNLRSKIFIARMGAQLSWPNKNKLSLEPASAGATSWVHMDVREFEDRLKADRYYATSQAMADGSRLFDLARQESRLKLLNCAGIPRVSPVTPTGRPANSPAATPHPVRSPEPARRPTPPTGEVPSGAAGERLPVSSLKISKEAVEFIKGWEKFGPTPYDDSEGFCTVGWGHLLAKERCETMKAKKSPDYEFYKDGVDEKEAEALLKKDIHRISSKVALIIRVPLHQHEYDALMCLAFNTGGISKFPNLMRKLNTGDYNGCCDEFRDITNGGTKGLVARRQAEMKMFRNKIYDSTH